jgi:hypothetical protein
MPEQLTTKQQAFENEYGGFTPEYTEYYQNFRSKDWDNIKQYVFELNKPNKTRFYDNPTARYVEETIKKEAETESPRNLDNMVDFSENRLQGCAISYRQLCRITNDDLCGYPSPKMRQVKMAFPTLNSSILPDQYANHLVASNEDVVRQLANNKPENMIVAIPEYSDLNDFVCLVTSLLILNIRFDVITPHTDFKSFDNSVSAELQSLFASREVQKIGGGLTRLYTCEKAIANVNIVNKDVVQELILPGWSNEARLLTRVTSRINPFTQMETSGWIYSKNQKQIEFTKARLQKLLAE